jgi:hypothetical protein
MGYNRSGTRRKQRLKRAKKHEERLAKKAEAGQGAPAGESHGLAAGVKKAAAGVAHAVGAAVHKVADALTGKKHETAAAPPKK